MRCYWRLRVSSSFSRHLDARDVLYVLFLIYEDFMIGFLLDMQTRESHVSLAVAAERIFGFKLFQFKMEYLVSPSYSIIDMNTNDTMYTTNLS